MDLCFLLVGWLPESVTAALGNMHPFHFNVPGDLPETCHFTLDESASLYTALAAAGSLRLDFCQ